MAKVTCSQCNQTFVPKGSRVVCPSCGTSPAPAKKAGGARPLIAPKRRVISEEEPGVNAPKLALYGGIALVVVVGAIVGISKLRSSVSTRNAAAVAQNAKPAPTAPPAVAQTPVKPLEGASGETPSAGSTEKPVEPAAGESTTPAESPALDPFAAKEGPGLGEGGEPAAPERKAAPRRVEDIDQAAVEQAIAKGTRFLAGSTKEWMNHHDIRIGHISLCALALLESDVPPNDPVILESARLVRLLAPAEEKVYGISTAILFLDRLGNPGDRTLIRTLSARLVAGQKPSGGWTYVCPILSVPETNQLLALLGPAKTPVVPGGLMAAKLIEDAPAAGLVGDGGDKGKEAGTLLPISALAWIPTEKSPPKVLPKGRTAAAPPVAAPPPPPAGKNEPIRPGIPAIVNRGRAPGQYVLDDPLREECDNSNVQFALLGLWAARRHGVNSDVPIMMVAQRMRATSEAGKWKYQPTAPTSASMSCVGLLALAMDISLRTPPGRVVNLMDDPLVPPAIAVVAEKLAEPLPNPESLPDLYFAWSTERVAMVFGMSEINGINWYAWGTNQLLKKQKKDGSWEGSSFPGASPHVCTSFALLFIQRSNLVREISEQIRRNMPADNPPPPAKAPLKR